MVPHRIQKGKVGGKSYLGLASDFWRADRALDLGPMAPPKPDEWIRRGDAGGGGYGRRHADAASCECETKGREGARE